MHLHRAAAVIASVVAAAFVACGGTSTPTDPPTGLLYSSNPGVYTVGSAITPNTPTSSGGAVASYAVSPALPPGLSLNTPTGVIGGTPTAVTPAANYTVTATNATGSTTAIINVAVNAVIPPTDLSTPLPPGLGPAALVTDLGWPAACTSGTGTGTLTIGASIIVLGSPGYTERHARGCVASPLLAVWQALQIPTGIDVAFWPERTESDCEPRRDVESGYAVSFLTKEIPHGGIQSHYTFEVTWRAELTQGTTSAPTEVKMFYGKTFGTVEVPWLRGSAVFTTDSSNPGWTRIELVRQYNSNGHADDPTKLLNWLQGFYDGLQTQLSTGTLTPRYCVLP